MSQPVGTHYQLITSILEYEQSKPQIKLNIQSILQQIDAVSKLSPSQNSGSITQALKCNVQNLKKDVRELQGLSNLLSEFQKAINGDLNQRKTILEKGFKMLAEEKKPVNCIPSKSAAVPINLKAHPRVDTNLTMDDSLISLQAQKDLKEIFSPKPLGEEFIEVSPAVRPSAPPIEDQEDEEVKGELADVEKMNLLSDYFLAEINNGLAVHQ